jgi:hypothetical protein
MDLLDLMDAASFFAFTLCFVATLLGESNASWAWPIMTKLVVSEVVIDLVVDVGFLLSIINYSQPIFQEQGGTLKKKKFCRTL